MPDEEEEVGTLSATFCGGGGAAPSVSALGREHERPELLFEKDEAGVETKGDEEDNSKEAASFCDFKGGTSNGGK